MGELVDDGFEVGDGTDGWKIGRAASGSEAEGDENEREGDAAAIESAEQSAVTGRWMAARARQAAPGVEDGVLVLIERG